MYLPHDNVTLLEGYTEEELKNIRTIIDDRKDVIWDMEDTILKEADKREPKNAPKSE